MKKCSYCGVEYPDDVVLCALDQTSLDNPPPSFSFPWAGFFAWAGLVVGILGTTNAALLSLPFFWLHHDIANGAVLWFAFLCMTGFWTFVLGLPCSIVGIVKRRRVVGWLGVIFAIVPVPLGFAMLHVAMALNGFHIDA